MTLHFTGCRMTAKDFNTCRTMLAERAGDGSPFSVLLRDKLASATVLAEADIDPLTVTLFSRVEFAVDDEPPHTRILVRNAFQNGLVGLTLPLSTMRGLVLLGLRPGRTCVFDEGGRERTVFVRRVLYQPEAARGGRTPADLQPPQPAKIIDLARMRAARGGRPAGSGRDFSLSGRKGTPN